MAESKQSKGGKSRASKLSPQQRSEIAKKGAKKRWEKLKQLPKATHGSPDHPLKIGDAELQCYVLSDGRRVISQRGMNAALGRAEAGSISRRQPVAESNSTLPSFLYPRNIRPFIADDLIETATNPIAFALPSGNSIGHGYPAEMLPEICEVWLNAQDAGVLTIPQHRTAEAAQAIIRSLAKVGIVALVDEATGYQAERDRDELNRLLEVYLNEERLAWAKRFPDEFYKQVYRLKKWGWPVGKAKTPLLGKITNDIVYERLPKGVLEKLQTLNPVDAETKRRKHKHHQYLSEEVGQPDLRDHLLQVVAVMKVSSDWEDFKRKVDKAFPKQT